MLVTMYTAGETLGITDKYLRGLLGNRSFFLPSNPQLVRRQISNTQVTPTWTTVCTRVTQDMHGN